MENEIINRVANSSLVSFDLEEYYPNVDIISFDLANYLWNGLILKEKDFRESLKNTDWTAMKGKLVAVHCSADVIIPTWAFLLVSVHLSQNNINHAYGKPEELLKKEYLKTIESIDFNAFKDAKVVIKGCSKKNVPLEAYVFLSEKMHAVASSIMFGEPCSTVPIWKKGKKV